MSGYTRCEFEAQRCWYLGVREKTAVVLVDGLAIDLGLGDTHRCTEDEKITADVLKAVCESRDVRMSPQELATEAARLTAFCRRITRHDPTAKRRGAAASPTYRSLSWRV